MCLVPHSSSSCSQWCSTDAAAPLPQHWGVLAGVLPAVAAAAAAAACAVLCVLMLQAVPVAGLEEAFRRLPPGGSYGGIPLGGSSPNGETAAAVLHKHIACALQQHEDFKPVFSGQGARQRIPLLMQLASLLAS